MTVQELIDKLQEVKDKTLPVVSMGEGDYLWELDGVDVHDIPVEFFPAPSYPNRVVNQVVELK